MSVLKATNKPVDSVRYLVRQMLRQWKYIDFHWRRTNQMQLTAPLEDTATNQKFATLTKHNINAKMAEIWKKKY